ncbi:MAG: NADH-quinone oxidoreductase subunit D [Actinomycetes bacterium]
MTERKLVGISPIDAARSDATSELSAEAPATHGMLRIELGINGDQIISANPILGSMHRGAEKLFESRDYRQVIGLANRHEWLSAFSGEVGVAQLIEQALGIEVPDAAQWLRTLLLEFNRVTSHLAFLAGFPWGNSELISDLRLIRERWVIHFRDYTGSRMHPMVTRIGGLTHAPDSEWMAHLAIIAADTEKFIVDTNWIAQTAPWNGIGILTKQAAQDFAISGPVARATGYPIDSRESAIGVKYQKLDSFAVAIQSAGDVASRLSQLTDELTISVAMIKELTSRCMAILGEEVNVLLPKVVRVPEGTYEHGIETPLGIASWFLVSRNDKMPYRLKLRPASLHTVLALPEVLVGEDVNNFDAIVASMPFVAGDVDR